MSRVIDGRDILLKYSSVAIAMGKGLDALLNGREGQIPKGAIEAAQRLFFAAMNGIRNRKSPKIPKEDFLVTSVTYRLVTDMIKRVIPKANDVDSELEKLASAIQVLTPDGEQIVSNQRTYETLRDVFNNMYIESCNYPRHYGSHSPYSVGTFDNYDDD